MERRRLLLALLSTLVLSLVFSSLGCKSKASLDADVDHLLVAIGATDYEHFKADAHPALVTEVSKQEFDGMAKVLKKFGPMKSKTMTSIRVKAGAPTEGDYNLVFANGSCTLLIKSVDGKLAGFHFTGPDVQRLSKAP